MSESRQKNLYLSGFASCGAFKQAKQALTGLQAIFPNEFAVTVHECKDNKKMPHSMMFYFIDILR
jgi:hypothetical protein